MTNDQTLQDLNAVRELLAPPGRWTQGGLAKDAASFCLRGAMFRVGFDKDTAYGDSMDRLDDMSRVLRGLLPNGHMIGWNDVPWRTHAEVLVLLDLAIASLQQPPPSVWRTAPKLICLGLGIAALVTVAAGWLMGAL